MVPSLIKLFKTVAVRPDEHLLDPVEVNAYALRCGYFVMPGACTADCIAFLKTQEMNPNSTFYTDWGDVERRSELELHITQLIHYLSTYGTDFQGPTFTLKDFPAELTPSRLTVLKACTERELFNRIEAMLDSGIAISDDTLDQLIDQLEQFMYSYGWRVDVDKVANREAEIRLCRLYGILPTRPERLVRYLVYAATGMSTIIKNSTTWARLSDNAAKIAPDLRRLDETHIRALASVFYRYKPVFLAIRSGIASARDEIRGEQPWEKKHTADYIHEYSTLYSHIVRKINRIRRLARRYHRPMKPGVLESLLAGHDMDTIRAAVDAEKSMFKLVKLLNYLDYSRSDTDLRAYIIRNGKVFFKEAPRTDTVRLAMMSDIRNIVRQRLITLLAAKTHDVDGRTLTVRRPAYVEIAAPVSERQMVGAMPYGSTYTLARNNYIGIYWRNEWGTRDFDLWLTDSDGNRLGWASQHKTDQLLFSGDMTNADPEATEIFYGRGSWPDSTVQVLRYNGEQGSKFRLFFGSDDIRQLPQGYMVNPDSIHFTEDLVSDSREKTIALIHNGKVYFTAVSSGDHIVPSTDKSVTAIDALTGRLQCCAMLWPLLAEAGFAEYDPASALPPDIDLTQPDKDTLIRLFA